MQLVRLCVQTGCGCCCCFLGCCYCFGCCPLARTSASRPAPDARAAVGDDCFCCVRGCGASARRCDYPPNGQLAEMWVSAAALCTHTGRRVYPCFACFSFVGEVIHLTSSVPASGIPSDGAGVPGSRIPTVASSLSMSSVSPSSNPAGGGLAAPGSPAAAEARSAAAGPRFNAAADGVAPTKVVPGGPVTAKGRQDVGTELQNQAQGLSSAGDPASPGGGDGRAPTASSRSHVHEAGGRAAAGDGAAAAAGAPVAFAVGAGKDGSTAEAGATQAGEQNSLLSAPPHPMHDQGAGPPDAEDIDRIPDDDPQLHTLPDGAVGRRAPANPLNSPLVARLIGGKRKKRPKVKDPKLLNNPLRGRLLVCISTTALLFWIFLWELLYNYTSYNGRCVSAVYYPNYKLTDEKDREPFVIRYGYGACDHNLGSLAKPRATLGHRASDKGWPTDLVPNGSAGSSNAEWDAPNPRIFRVLGGLETNYMRNYGEIFRLFTSMYLHGGWLHILINISCQIQMFWIIEPDWGFWRTTLLFFLGGITGSLLSAVADPCNITVGSSGAMYALLAALIPYCVEYWKSIPRPVCILIFMIVVLIVGIITGLSGFTDNYAHIGGCVGGILWGFASITTVSACDKCTLGERMATTPPFSWCVSKQTQEKLLERARRRKADAVRRRKIQAAHKKKAGGARGKAMYALKMRLQEEGRPPCKMSFREWFVRGLAAGGLIIFWVVMFLYLLDPTLYKKYPPPGQLKFEGWLFCKCGTIVYEAKQTIGNLGKFWCFSSEKDVDFYLKR